MKKITILVFALFLLIFGCSSKDENPTGGNTGGTTEDPSITSLSGVISNWTYGDNYRVTLGTYNSNYGYSDISATGSFDIQSLQQPSIYALRNLMDSLTHLGCSGSINISDAGLKVSKVNILRIYLLGGNYFNEVYYGNSTHMHVYIFADRNANLDVNLSCGSSNIKYLCSVKTGWNRLTSPIIDRSRKSYEYTNNVIPGATWHLW